MTEATEKDLKDLRAPSAHPPTAEEVAEELGERVAARGFVTYEDFADAIRAAEQRRDAMWAEALNLSHYDSIDGPHLDCALCTPLRALLYGERASQEAPSNPSDLPSSLTREREENQRLTRALRAAESAIIDEIAIADQRNEEYRRKDKTYDQAFFAGYGNGLGYARRMIIDALTSGASAAQPPPKDTE